MNQENYPDPYHNHEKPLENVAVTPIMEEHLRATKPWVRFLSVVMFILSGLMILFALAMIFSGGLMGRGVGFGPLVGIIYLLVSGLYLVPAFFLHQYASNINDFLQGGGDSAMESALGSQKSFWRFVGITSLVIICIYVLVFIIAILGAMTAFR